MELQGKTAMVTGGGIRLGRAFALAMAREGANILVHYNNSQEPAEETANKARDLGVKAYTLGADFNNMNEVEQVFSNSRQYFDHVDVLINSAAIYLKGKGLETDRETWEKQFRINLQAPFILIKTFAQQLPEKLPGKVLNIADAQILEHKPDHFAYRLTKNALVEMTRLFALELAPQICVNALGLGIMLPLAGKEDANLQAYDDKYVPLKTTGSPEIAARHALHLIKSDFATGAFLRVDGGQYLL